MYEQAIKAPLVCQIAYIQINFEEQQTITTFKELLATEESCIRGSRACATATAHVADHRLRDIRTRAVSLPTTLSGPDMIRQNSGCSQLASPVSDP